MTLQGASARNNS
jgi:hypothetical protein